MKIYTQNIQFKNLIMIFLFSVLLIYFCVILKYQSNSSILDIKDFDVQSDGETNCDLKCTNISITSLAEEIFKSQENLVEKFNLKSLTNNKENILNLKQDLRNLTTLLENLSILRKEENEAKKFESKHILMLPEMTEYLKSRNESKEAIFFTETSDNGKIKARFVCALESAATVNPNSDIYLLMLTKPPYQLNLTENVALDWARKHHPNIQILACDLDILFKGSIIEDFYLSGKLENSTFKAAHTSDIIRVYVLWKYGGKYFDLDIIFLRPMTHIINFAVEQDFSRGSLNNGMLGFTKNSSVALDILLRSVKNFNGDDWAANGPNVVSNKVWELCGYIPVVNYTEEKCQGFTVIKNWEFFPINYDKLWLYFETNETKSKETMMMIDSKMPQMYAIHIGNNIVQHDLLYVNSKQPYGLLAQRYCPRAYWSCDKLF